MAMAIQAMRIPREFIFRRMHSLMGFWFLLFLMEHLFTNSQVALFFSNDELWFVRSVNFLGNLPYLHVIEVVLLGVPIVYHAIFGILYMRGSRLNAITSDGSQPLIKSNRNYAYTLQRGSAWVLLFGILFHVVQMRFIDYPYKYQGTCYARLTNDPGLKVIADRLGVEIYDEKAIFLEKEKLHQTGAYGLEGHVRGLESRRLAPHQVMIVSKSFGSIELLTVREAFQSIWMCLFYTIFVLAAVFHGFNGLWTFLITWGVILSKKSQSQGVLACTGLMFVMFFLGMMAIWGSYLLG